MTHTTHSDPRGDDRTAASGARRDAHTDPLLSTAAGVLGAAAALATGELLSGFSRAIPSLVIAMGEVFVDKTPGSTTETAIQTVGKADKPILVTTIVVASLVVGALVGRAGARRRRVVPVTFAAFAVLGGWAAARNPFATFGWAWFAALLSAAVGALVTLALLKAADGTTLGHDDDHNNRTSRKAQRAAQQRVASTRRAFLVYSGTAAVGTLVATAVGRALRGSRSIEGVRQELAARGLDVIDSPADQAVAKLATLDDVTGISPYVTPLSGKGFYRIDTALSVPQIDPSGWKLSIGGLVDKPYELTYDDILAMATDEQVITLACVSNEVGGDLVGNAVWTGVPLLSLIERAVPKPTGVQVIGRSVDDFVAGFPLDVLRDGRHTLLAIAMNGQPLPAEHGFPARLVVSGLYGYVSAVKWLREIRLDTMDVDGYWIPRGWSKLGPMKTASRIDVPDDGAKVAVGRVAVAGVAWSPTRGIAKVEVQIDDGPWQPCRLGSAVSNETWVQWVYDWDAPAGKHDITVRATDNTGAVQPAAFASPRPNGSEGLHSIAVRVG